MSCFIRLRGLPWSVTHQEILDFLQNVNVVNGTKGIHIVLSRWDGKNTGEAFVELESEEDEKEAFKLNRNTIGHRYIEVFSATTEEARHAIKNPGSNVSNVVKLRGLPYAITEDMIAEFFNGLNFKRNGVLIVMDRRGRATGEAYVQFENVDDTEQALLRNREKIGHRYIEIFRSSLAEMRRQSHNRPGPYDIKERGDFRNNHDDFGGNFNNILNSGFSNKNGFGGGGYKPKKMNNFGGNRSNLSGFGMIDGGLGGGGGGGNSGGYENFNNSINNFDRIMNNNNNNNNMGMSNKSSDIGCNLREQNFNQDSFWNNKDGNTNMRFGNDVINQAVSCNNDNGGNNNGFNRDDNIMKMNTAMGGNNSMFNKNKFGNNFGNNGNNGNNSFGNNGNNSFGNNGNNGNNSFGNNNFGNNNFGNNNFGNNNFGNNNFSMNNKDLFCIHMRGLPYTTFENDVLKFFQPLRPDNIKIIFNNKGFHSGSADVYFSSYDDSQLAMKKHMEQIGTRYIELFFDGKAKAKRTGFSRQNYNNF